MDQDKKYCKDGGVCHHFCKDGECFREENCAPLSVSDLNDDWTEKE